MTVHRGFVLILSVAWLPQALAAATTAPPHASASARKMLKDLLAEYNEGVQGIRREMLHKMSLEDVNQKLWSDGPFERLAHFGPRFLALARQNPRTDVGWASVRWVVYVRGFSKTDKAAALEQMLRDHMQDDEFYEDLFQHLYRPGVDAENFYREVLKRPNAPRRVTGLACYSLAVWLNRHGGEKETSEALRLFQRVGAEYADLPHPYDPKRGTLGDAAARARFEIEHLQVGKPAPDIVGEDVEGRPFRLSAFRGKVIVVVFCGDWCGPCHKLYPLEKKWSHELSGRPFAIVGVNSDPSATLRAAIEREKFPFRWFSDGSTHGPISSRWNIETWPTVYVLDRQGTFRMKKIGAGKPDEIKTFVDQLLTEPNQSAKRSLK
jgi:peroxiredoxin